MKAFARRREIACSIYTAMRAAAWAAPACLLLGAMAAAGQDAYLLATGEMLVGPAAGSNGVILVSQLADDDQLMWTATNESSWLHVATNSQRGSGSAIIVFSYDANAGATRIGTLDIAGQFLTVTQAGSTYVQAPGPVTTLAASGLSEPEGVAVDDSGNVYFADANNNAIKEWVVSSNAVITLVSSNLNFPTGVAVDSADNVFFADSDNNELKEWVSDGGSVSTLIGNFAGALPALDHPFGVALDSDDDVYIGDSGHNELKEWISDGGSVSTLVTNGISDPQGVALGAAGDVYIADWGDSAIKKLISGGTNLITLVSLDTGPEGVAVDTSGNVYFAASADQKIEEWSPVSNSVTTLASAGLNFPSGVAVDATGNVYFANFGNSTIDELPYAFVSSASVSEAASAGSDELPTVLPASENLLAPFAPTSSQSWLAITSVAGGVVSFAFATNATASYRTAIITVLGQPVSVTQAPGAAPLSVTWNSPGPIVYGTALTGSQLDASANVSGVFAYTPAAGAVLNAGTNILSAVFTPADTAVYSSVTEMVTLVVTPAPLTVTAANASRAYGEANPSLTGAITGLTNGDDITATYSSIATATSPVGGYPITPTLADPDDRLPNYTVSLVNGTLTVTQAVPLVTWATPAPMIYGTALTSVQLDATASVPGTFAYTPTNGSVLNVGTQTLSVLFTPSDTIDYTSVTKSVSVVVLPVTSSSQAITILHSFGGSDGEKPSAGLTASGGTLFGTTTYGGSAGSGVVYSINTDGSGFSVLHSFTSAQGSDVTSDLFLSGNMLYGAASQGGANSSGTLFSLDTDGSAFTNNLIFNGTSEGGDPLGGVLLSGNFLYGTASAGGSNGNGVVFAVEPNGSNYTALHVFGGKPDGSAPQCDLALGNNVLYGTTSSGGLETLGTIFSVETNGNNYAVLHSFSLTDGEYPEAGLVLSGGTLYGTAYDGGAFNDGTVFSINANGSNFTVLHSFNSITNDGLSPVAALFLSGNVLYGTTSEGGAFGKGTVFSLDTNGNNYTQLYSFGAGGATDGANPNAPVVVAGNYLYGTTVSGGTDGLGTDYALKISGVTFTSVPTGATNVTVGSEVSFSASGLSLTNPGVTVHYQWRLNGVNIPGATTETLSFQDVQITNGGSLTLTISDGTDTATSVPVGFSVGNLKAALGNSNFASRFPLGQAAVDAVASSNTNGAPETGEPEIITGNPGGKPVWFAWQPTTTGTAIFSTQGSDFDTILGVYTGPSLSSLTRVPSCVNDDDAGGYLTSRVSFNCSAGTEYEIVVDGYWGVSGNVVLSWTTENLAEPLPTLLQAPPRQTVASNDATITLVCQPDSGLPSWLFDGQPTGVTGPDFLISTAPDAINVGSYVAQVTIGGGVTTTEPAHVQINVLEDGTSDTNSVAWNKFLDSANAAYSNPPGPSIRKLGGGGDTAGFSVAQTFSTVGAVSEPGEPTIDGQIGGAPVWYTYVTPTNGAMLIDTAGSSFNTLLGVFVGPGTSFATLTNIGAGYTTNFFLNGQPQVYLSNVPKGQTNFIVVDGYNGDSGTVHLHINVGIPVVIATPPQNQSVVAGSSATFTVGASGSTPLSYFWQFNGANIAGATNVSLTVPDALAANIGVYTVVVSNLVSVVSNSATLSLLNTLQLGAPSFSSKTFQLQLSGAPGGSYVLEASTNLVTWIPLATNTDSTGVLQLTDTNAGSFDQRFYRGVTN